MAFGQRADPVDGGLLGRGATAAALPRVGDDLRQHLVQAERLDGLRQERREPGTAVRMFLLPAAERAQHDQREVATGRGAPDGLGQRVPVHPGHRHVQQGQVERGAALEQLDGLGSGRDLHGRHRPRPQLLGEDQPVGGVVVHHQHPEPVEHRDVGSPLGPVLADLGEHREMEPRPGVHGALRPHPPAHHLGQPLADGEPQAGPPVLPGDGGVQLAERAEQPLHRLRRDADPGVQDGEVHVVAPHIPRTAGHGDDDLAPFGELDGVREEVHQDLTDPRAVADERGGDLLVHEVVELEALRRGGGGHHVQRLLHADPDLERRVLHVHPAGLDLQLGVEEQAGQADHRVERGSDLVTHVRQELALRPAGGLGQLLGDEQGLLGLLARRDVAGDPQEAHHAVALVLGGGGELANQVPAVLPVDPQLEHRRRVTLQHLLDEVDGDRDVLRVEEREERLPDPLVPGPARDGLERLVQGRHRAL